MHNVARSLGYVLFLSLIFLLAYIVGVISVKISKKDLSEKIVKLLRAFMCTTILVVPILLQYILFDNKVLYTVVPAYVLLAMVLSHFLSYKIDSINVQKVWNKIKRRDINLLLVLLAFYLYFVLSAFAVGYIRPYFRHSYPSIEVNNEFYYILAKNDKGLILSKDTRRKNDEFFVYPCEPHPNNLCVFRAEHR